METNRPDYTETLTRHGIRPTAVRMLVLDAMERFSDTFTLADLEEATDGMDRSSIYRTLTLFVRRHLLHLVEDGSGSAKYCVCHNDHACRIDEMHCHFHCEACGRTPLSGPYAHSGHRLSGRLRGPSNRLPAPGTLPRVQGQTAGLSPSAGYA